MEGLLAALRLSLLLQLFVIFRRNSLLLDSGGAFLVGEEMMVALKQVILLHFIEVLVAISLPLLVFFVIRRHIFVVVIFFAHRHSRLLEEVVLGEARLAEQFRLGEAAASRAFPLSLVEVCLQAPTTVLLLRSLVTAWCLGGVGAAPVFEAVAPGGLAEVAGVGRHDGFVEIVGDAGVLRGVLRG